MDQEVFDIINRISAEHSKKVFGYLTEDDLKNEIWVICLDKLNDFDGDRGKLEHFLRVSVKNRLINRYKDVAKIVRSPCPKCPFYDLLSPSDCGKFGDSRHLCKKWKKYETSKHSRNCLLNSTEQVIDREHVDDVLGHMSNVEIKDFLFENISSGFKRDLQCLFDGYRLNKNRLNKLKNEINKIIEEFRSRKDGFVQLSIRGQDATTPS